MHTPTLLEILVFVVLLVASVCGFWRRFGPKLKVILASKRDAEFVLGPVWPRIRAVLWEVVLQGKVIRERPLPGLAHALVFWGFCSFALITCNHLAEGLGLHLISRDGALSFVFTVAAVFAVLVAVAIAGLAVRRFVVRPKWLGTVAPESGIIAFLIFALMATYLPGVWLSETSAWGGIIWWAHTLVLLAFLPVIPHTKHLHLVLSPFTVFLKRRGFSAIPPLAGDEDFGLDTGKDVTRIAALQAYTCVECGRCTEHCPAYNTGKVLNPKEVILGARRYLNEFGAAGSEPLIGKHESLEALFQCTTCGACEYQCPVGVQHLPIIVGLRRGAVNTGKWEDDYGTKLFLNLERHGNAMGFSPAEREKFIQKNKLPFYDGSQEYCLWLGCMGSYDPAGREIVLALAEVMKRLGIGFGVLKKEKCSGDPVRRLGNDYLFSQLVESNVAEIEANKVRKMVSICPHCVRTISEDWKEYGAKVQVEHHSELLARFRSQLPQTNGQSVVYHDPCYLGRYRNIYEEPRAVIGRWGKVADPPRARQRSFCCGAGGGLAFLGEEKGNRVSAARATELAATGAAVVGVACPFCNTMFRDALPAVSANPPKLMDIAQIAAASLR
jgi:Fe-S oxidoreductase